MPPAGYQEVDFVPYPRAMGLVIETKKKKMIFTMT
jgi:hypothetical protein